MDRVIKALIADDEPTGRRALRKELELLPELVVLGEAENGLETLKQIVDQKPDLVFFDPHLPVMGGFELVRNLGSSHLPVIVIVTTFPEHALEAFEAGATDYLLKPVSAARLQKALQRVKRLLVKPPEIEDSLAKFVSAVDKSMPIRRKLVGRAGREYYFLDTDDIIVLQAEGDLVWIVTLKHRLLANESLCALEEDLRSLFFLRVHRNAIVNINHVRKLKSLSSQRWTLTLSNDLELVVSKRQAHTIRSVLGRKRLARSQQDLVRS
jgi:DNA-binding LytR/AlgR family response regulator